MPIERGYREDLSIFHCGACLGHGRKRAVRAQLYEGVGVHGERSFDRMLIEHGAAEVLPPVVGIEAVVEGAGYGRDDGQTRRRRVEPTDMGLEDLLHGIEPARVIREIERQLAGEQVGLIALQAGNEGVYCVFITGQRHHVGRVVAADLDGAVGGKQRCDVVRAEPDSSHRAAAIDGVADQAAVGDEPGHRGFGDAAGKEGGGDFAEAVTEHNIRAYAEFGPEVGEAGLESEHHRRCDRGIVDAAMLFVRGQFCHHGPAGDRLELAVELQHRVAEDGLAGQQLAAHRPPLAALSGHREADLALAMGPACDQLWWRAAVGLRPVAAGGEAGQPLSQVLDACCENDGPMLVRVMALGQCSGDLAEVTVGEAARIANSIGEGGGEPFQVGGRRGGERDRDRFTR